MTNSQQKSLTQFIELWITMLQNEDGNKQVTNFELYTMLRNLQEIIQTTPTKP